MIVVADTSPLLNLALIGRLDLVPSLYQQVLVPPAVFAELTYPGHEMTLIDSSSCPWLVVRPAKNRARVDGLRTDLDAGEAEAIVLALEQGAQLLLIDERRGRHTAEALGLRVTGLIGLLAEAKRADLVERVKPVLDDLIHRAGFWISAALYERVLTELNEQ